MSAVQPVDYVVIGLMNAIYIREGSTHSLTIKEAGELFKEHNGCSISAGQLDLALRRLEHENVVTLVVDPYADTLIETNDRRLAIGRDTLSAVVKRGWNNEAWLKTALNNPRLWADIDAGVELAASIEQVPSADGFVAINHNSAEAQEIEQSIVAADEVIRSDNEMDAGERGWIRSHLEAGLLLIRGGGPVLRGALLSLVLEPLKAAAKAAASTNAKLLIDAAIAAIRALLGI